MTRLASRVRQTAVAQPESPATGRTRRNLHLGLAIRSLHRHGGTKRCLPRGEWQVYVDVTAVQAISGVRRSLDDQVQIARLCSVAALAALASEPDPLSFRHTCRDGHLQRACPLQALDGDGPAATAVSLIHGDL